MKNVLKVCAIAGAVLLVSGGLITAVSLKVQGAAGLFGRPAAQSAGAVSGELPESAADATSFDFELTTGNLSIQPGERLSVTFGGEIAKYAVASVEGGTLRLRDTINRRGFRWWKNSSSEELAVTVTVPQGKEFDKIAVSVGEGECSIRSLTADEFQFDCGAGEFQLEDVTARTASLSGGVGEFRASGLTVSEGVTVEAGVGETDIRGDLRGDISVNGGVGDVRVDFTGARGDYFVKGSAGIGELMIDGDSTGGIGGEIRQGDGGAPNRVDVSCGVGSIELNFAEQ